MKNIKHLFAFSVFPALKTHRTSAAAHRAFLWEESSNGVHLKRHEECFGSPSLPYIPPAGSWWVATFHSHASFLPGDEMCMEVSVRVQLTAPPRPAPPRLCFPVHCLVTNAGFILVKCKRRGFIIFQSIFTCNGRTDAVWMGSDWCLHASSDFPAEILLISVEIDGMCAGIITETTASRSANASAIWIRFIRHSGGGVGEQTLQKPSKKSFYAKPPWSGERKMFTLEIRRSFGDEMKMSVCGRLLSD